MTKTKSFTKSILSVFLCMVMLLTVFMCVPFTASAEVEYSFEENGIRYLELDDTTVSVVGVNSETLPEDIVVSSTVQGKTVTEIGVRAFYNTNIKSITLPKTVVAIGEYAFCSCDYLESVVVLSNITELRDNTFSYCSALKELVFPDSLKHIGQRAFYQCDSLENVHLPKNLETIGYEAFMRCKSIKQVTINSALHTIDSRAFYELTALTDVIFEERATLLSLGGSAFAGCGNLTQFDFTYCNNIGSSSFARCTSLTSIVLPDEIDVTLGSSAFYGCTNLKTAKLSDNIDAIPSNCFCGCNNFESVQTGNIKLVYEDAFYGCSRLTDISFAKENSITRVYSGAFQGCSSLTEISLPYVKNINIDAFYGCTSLTTVDLEGNTTLKTIGPNAFYNCKSLESMDIPSSCTKIGNEAFMNCESLYEVNLKSGLKEIGIEAFFNCFSLYYITIPKSVQSIGNMALGCFQEDNQNYVFGDFVVVGVSSSLADEYADAYNVYWALSAPKLTKIQNTSSGVKITFSKPSGASSGKYEIYRCTESTEWKKIGTTSSLSYTDKTAKAGKKYYYTVQFVGKPTNSLNDLPLEIVRLTNPSVSKITNTTTGAKITWGKVTGAAEYKVYVKSGTSWKTLGSTSGTSYTHTSAASGKTYTYTVKAYDSSGDYASGYKTAGWSNKFVASPKIKSISNTSTGAKITWGKVSGAAKYRVFVKSGDSWKKLKDTTSTSYTHTGLTSGKTYTYTVRCISSTGKSYTSSYDTTGTKNTYVKRPSISKITNTVDGPKLSWSKVAGATKYNVYVKSGSSWKLLGCTDSTSFVHETATSGKTYTYTLRCADGDGKNISAYNSTGWQNKYIAAPVITSLENTSKGVKITWDKVSGAAKYRVFVKSGDSWKKLKDTTSTSYTHTGLSSGKTYTYTVRCISSTGKSYTSSYDTVGQAIVFEK